MYNYNLFFELIQISLGNRDKFSHLPSDAEWLNLYNEACRQSLVGILFVGVEKTFEDQQKPDWVYQWIGDVVMLQNYNQQVTETVGFVRKHFEGQGMKMVLLKGQGNGVYYNELAEYRTPGDIDAWVFPNDYELKTINDLLHNDELVLRWLWKQDPERRHCYIHTDYPKMNGVAVELHFRPSYLNSPHNNRKIQRWFVEHLVEQAHNEVILPNSNVKVCIPTIEFNLVYQLSHLYRHIFDDGLGLRQVVDYYMLLKTYPANHGTENINDIVRIIKKFGMYHFACALMYVIHEVLGMHEERLLCPLDVKRGQLLLSEIMLAGNFGQYDSRNIRFKHNNGVTRFLRRQWRNMRFLWDYPVEVSSVLLYRIYQEFWRWQMNRSCRKS